MKIINDINGLIVLDKPKGFTSNDCLSIIKKYLHPKKIGHTGTLDLNATGVLICLLGDATKSQDYLMKAGDKLYDAELILGIPTDTEDITGKIISTLDKNVNDIDDNIIKGAIKSFIGKYNQIPPMYSAKKIDGKKLLNLARKGKDIKREPCEVDIKSIEIKEIENYDLNSLKLKKVKIIVNCSKGTYIRTLCKDIGEKIGIPACMGELRRLRNYDFKIEDSITLDKIKEKVDKNDFSFIKPCYYSKEDTTLTFGKFETLHLGHQEIIKDLVFEAKKNNYKSTVIIVGDNSDSTILSYDQRISKIKYLGVDNIINFPLDFTNKIISAEDFVNNILYKQLKAKIIIVGNDCRFGYRGEGNKDLLVDLCNKLHIKVKVIDKLKIKNTNIDISSTYIREEYDKGNFEVVNELLGK